MSINLEINHKQLSEILELQFLPAEIDNDGEAKVEEYFNKYTEKENGHLTNALRGFPLDGMEFDVPNNLVGVVFQESKDKLDETSDRLLRVTGTFDKFTYWNYDKVPSADDGLRRALQVLSVADQVSKPISEEEIQKELNKHGK